MSKIELIEGAYYSYTPESRHAREGYAIALKYNDSEEFYLADTFWGVDGRSSGMGWHFSEKEKSTAEFLFNPNDTDLWRLATINDNPDDFESEDRQVITSQHGHYHQTWLKVGATVSDRVRLANMTEEVRRAESELQSAVSRLTFISERRAVLIHEMTMKEKNKKA